MVCLRACPDVAPIKLPSASSLRRAINAITLVLTSAKPANALISAIGSQRAQPAVLVAALFREGPIGEMWRAEQRGAAARCH
jgi:hypothetical protein